MQVKSTVIIPAHGREYLIERAIESIKNSNGGAEVEIIVIDDCSPIPIKLYRYLDVKVVRLETQSGAAVSRNKGIDISKGEIIYLLDSDDYFIDVDFENDYQILQKTPGLYFKSIKSQSYSSNYPDIITLDEFFDAIFWRYEHICQTSSLCFNRTLDLKFDVSLPKHQDWDFVYSALSSGIKVLQLKGITFFDRSDSNSLSRKYNSKISFPWFNKLSNDELSQDKLSLCHFHLFGKYPKIYGNVLFLKQSIKFIMIGKLRVTKLVKYFVHRLIQQINQFRQKQ